MSNYFQLLLFVIFLLLLRLLLSNLGVLPNTVFFPQKDPKGDVPPSPMCVVFFCGDLSLCVLFVQMW